MNKAKIHRAIMVLMKDIEENKHSSSYYITRLLYILDEMNGTVEDKKEK